ncbi:MAG TPA: bifunctional oligoribonuclease/PAP phosphatase NrnA [Ignavibacteriaceae bacterium]|nr:bifunctional oligoribonuclease/PAP phosphatase NrnA [Ignavibacteriaceae bacterium]
MIEDFNKLKNILVENNSFLLTTHVNPDADAIGSEIAMLEILKALGKKEIYIVNTSSTPYNLLFLDKGNIIQHYNSRHAETIKSVDVLIGLDFNRSDRLTRMREDFLSSQKLKIIIDHHQNPEDFVNHSFVYPDYSATGHIIYDFLKKTSLVELSYSISYPIYAAIMTDTGSFRFERTSPEIHLITAELISKGVNPTEVYDKIYDQSRFSKIKLLGNAISSLQLYGSKKQVGYMVIKQKDFQEFNALEQDTDTFVNFTLSIEGVNVGILFIELKNGFKISLRSKGNIPVNKLAAEFGGGGHINAAGIRIQSGVVEDYIPKILTLAEEYSERY